jgi:hypothetical protein
MRNKSEKLGNVPLMVFGIVLMLLAAMWLLEKIVR